MTSASSHSLAVGVDAQDEEIEDRAGLGLGRVDVHRAGRLASTLGDDWFGLRGTVDIISYGAARLSRAWIPRNHVFVEHFYIPPS